MFSWTRLYLKVKGVSTGKTPLFMHGLPLVRASGKISLGDNFRISSFQFKPELFCARGGSLTIGNNVYINRGVSISCCKNITIGDNCLIGDLSSIQDSNWHEVSEGKGIKTQDIVIGKNVWIGKNVIILPGVTIGDHSVIAAGSIISEDVPEKSLAYQERITKLRQVVCSDNYKRN